MAGARRLLNIAFASVYRLSGHGPLPALRSPSWTLNARSWLFMSAIRFGTPTVFWAAL
jgi:hypothetical protein